VISARCGGRADRIICAMQVPALPAAMTHALGRGPWARWLAPRPPAAVTAVMFGERCLAVRVEAGSTRPRLAQAFDGEAGDLAGWRSAGLFKGSRAVLVLGSADRHLLTLDRPDVPAAELPLAVRWPLGTALEVEPDALLTAAVEMPRINESLAPQVLAIAARIDAVRAHLATLRQAGIDVRSIDVSDSALRGMRALRAADNEGWVVLATVGHALFIGLLWQGEFCALRTLALPLRRPRDTQEFDEQLALHIQRTADLFERQARQLAIRQVLAALPSLSDESRASIGAALPLQTHLFSLGEAFDISDELLTRCAAHNDLTALACVAAARLADLAPPDADRAATGAAT
jgi:hypothetical protein